jgi:Spy/CpxP family protein refolding chaperone
MNRTLWSTVAAAAIAVAAAIPVIAQPPQGRAGGFGGPGGFGGRGGALPMLRTLDLTVAQREQIRTITRQQLGDAASSPQRKLADLQKQLQLAILAETPDTQKIDELKTSIAAAAADELRARIDTETRIAQVLTPEQRAKARDTLAKAGPPRRRGA